MAETKLILPEGYKSTELGPLPEEWEVVRLGDVALKTKQIDPKKLPNWRFKYVDVSAVSNESLSIQNYTEYEGKLAPSRARKLIQAGDVIFATVRPYLKRVAVVGPEFDGHICSTAFCVIRAAPDLADSNFLFFVSSTDNFVQRVSEHQRGSSYPAVADKDVLNELIPLPPLPEQRAIAHVLRTVQQAKEATEKIIASTRELKRSLIRHLFTYGPVPVKEVESVPLKETEIGPVPEPWEVVRLGDMSEKPQYGYTASAVENPIGPKFLRITDIQNDVVDWSSVPFCQCSERDFQKYKLQIGDVVFARIGATTGKSYFIEEPVDAVYASYLIRVKPSQPLRSDYLSYFTKTISYWTQINSSKGGRLKQGINIPILSNLLLPLPSLSEQREIARILSAVNAKISAEENRKLTLEVLFKTLLHHLMTGKLRVEVEPNAR